MIIKMKERFSPHDDPVQKALVTQFGQMRLNSAKVLRGPAVEPLHDLRIAALRAGFALKFFKKFLSTGHTDRLRDEFARARRLMAQRRDWDIFSSRIKKDFQVINTSSSLKQRILEIIKAQKTEAHQDLVKMLGSYRYKKMLRDLKDLSSTRNKRKLKPQNLFKGLLKGLERKQAAFQPSELHKFRITFKHLRYACEFLADFYDEKKTQGAIRDIIGIQDVLGEHQDAETTVRMLSCLKITGKSEEMGKLIEIEKNYTREARKKFAKMYKSKRCGIFQL